MLIVFVDHKHGDASRQCEAGSQSDDDITPKQLLITKRTDLDFTEQLWNILKGCFTVSS